MPSLSREVILVAPSFDAPSTTFVSITNGIFVNFNVRTKNAIKKNIYTLTYISRESNEMLLIAFPLFAQDSPFLCAAPSILSHYSKEFFPLFFSF